MGRKATGLRASYDVYDGRVATQAATVPCHGVTTEGHPTFPQCYSGCSRFGNSRLVAPMTNPWPPGSDPVASVLTQSGSLTGPVNSYSGLSS